jgi:hypothetical protein
VNEDKTASKLSASEHKAAWSRHKQEYRKRLIRDGQTSADRWLGKPRFPSAKICVELARLFDLPCRPEIPLRISGIRWQHDRNSAAALQSITSCAV